MKKIIFLLCICMTQAYGQKIKIGLLVYNGGGDWYANPTSLKNLAKFCNANLGTNMDFLESKVEVGSVDLFNYPLVHMTGHGRVSLSPSEAQNLRNYLMSGGFLHIDDNYGMDKYIRPELKKVFPDIDLIEIPFDHPIYHQKFEFKNGIPKIHEHENKPPRAYGIFYQGRLVCLYTAETDLGDGWEDPEVHKDPEERRQLALQMGANMIQFVFLGK